MEASLITFSFDMSSLISPAFTTPPRAPLPRTSSIAGSWRRSGGRAGRRQRRALAADIEQLERKLCKAVDLDQEDLADELADERDRLYDELDALVQE